MFQCIWIYFCNIIYNDCMAFHFMDVPYCFLSSAQSGEPQVLAIEVPPTPFNHLIYSYTLPSPSPTSYAAMLMVFLCVVLQNIDIIVLYACIFNL